MSIEEELAWEDSMVFAGRRNYYAKTIQLEQNGYGSCTSYGQRLIPELFEPVRDEIESWRTRDGPDFGGKYKPWLKGISSDQLAYFTLKQVLDDLIHAQNFTSTCKSIGRLIEDELRFLYFKQQEPNYVHWIQNKWDADGEEVYHRKRTGMIQRMRKIGLTWNSWRVADLVLVGQCMINCLTRSSDFIEIKKSMVGGKTKMIILPSEDTLEWIYTHQDMVALLQPVLLPMIAPPLPWRGFDDGGYYSPLLQSKSAQVKCKTASHREILRNTSMPEVWSAMSTLQSTPYQVNPRVLVAMQELWKTKGNSVLPSMYPIAVPPCPVDGEIISDLSYERKQEFIQWKQIASSIHRDNNIRVSHCLLLSRILRTAEDLAGRTLWYPCQGDFRNRLYSVVTGMAPQGSDYGRSLIEFAQGKRIDSDDAEKWFMVHGANCYGFDKLPFEERVQKIQDLKPMLLDIADNPVGTSHLWGEADEPWKFLAWCFEYQGLCRDRNFLSRIPIAMDGSCNGLQHFSALLRDPVGAAATNLIPGDRPSDIYRIVADRLILKLANSDHELARSWLEFGVDRNLTKKPVMTLPYGSTKRNCTVTLHDYLCSSGEGVFTRNQYWNASLFLTSLLWGAISDTVISAQVAMAWLREVGEACSVHDTPAIWTAPSGFVVEHAPCKIKTARVKSVLDNQARVTIGTYTDKISRRKMKNGVSPNFVHSLDASHLVFTLNAAANEGITDIQAIHDSYGTHAADTEKLRRIIREEFVRMYTQFDPLQDLYQRYEHLDLPEPPSKGDFYINQVLDSEYFFS